MTTLGAPRRDYPVAVSSEALALAWARQEQAPEGALVTVGQELSARGRRTAVWSSVAGRSLAASVVLRPAAPPEAEGLLWLAAASAAVDAVSEVAGAAAVVEWPNEIHVGGGVIGIVKVLAHLGPGRIDAAVVTLRLNTRLRPEEVPEAVRPHMTSFAVLDLDVDEEAVLDAFLAHLDRRYDQGTADVLAAFEVRCDTVGRPVDIRLVRRGEVTGVAVGVDPWGRLRVRTASGEVPVGLDVLDQLRRR